MLSHTASILFANVINLTINQLLWCILTVPVKAIVHPKMKTSKLSSMKAFYKTTKGKSSIFQKMTIKLLQKAHTGKTITFTPFFWSQTAALWDRKSDMYPVLWPSYLAQRPLSVAFSKVGKINPTSYLPFTSLFSYNANTTWAQPTQVQGVSFNLRVLHCYCRNLTVSFGHTDHLLQH